MYKRIVGGTVGMAFLAMAGSAHATFQDGDLLRIEWLYPNSASIFATYDVVVGAGVEVVDAAGLGLIDIDASDSTPQIRFDFTNPTFFLTTGPFNGFRFYDYTGMIENFGSVTINALTSHNPGIGTPTIAWTADSIGINFVGLGPYFSGDIVAFDVEEIYVPEPASLMLFGFGLTGIGFMTRRRRKTA